METGTFLGALSASCILLWFGWICVLGFRRAHQASKLSPLTTWSRLHRSTPLSPRWRRMLQSPTLQTHSSASLPLSFKFAPASKATRLRRRMEGKSTGVRQRENDNGIHLGLRGLGLSRNHATDLPQDVDIVVIGAGIGGLCAAAVLACCHKRRVLVVESHSVAGGCAHAFSRPVPLAALHGDVSVTKRDGEGNSPPPSFVFDSGPTILLNAPPDDNPVRQVLTAIGRADAVEWLPYGSWGVIVNEEVQTPVADKDHQETSHNDVGDSTRAGTRSGQRQTLQQRWSLELGPGKFESGPLREFGSDFAAEEFEKLIQATKSLSATASLPAMALRGGAGPGAIVPLLPHLGKLATAAAGAAKAGTTMTGTFEPFIDGPACLITDPWLRGWLDALAFSLSGLPAADTSAAAMATVLRDMHTTPSSVLEYPKGGLGAVVDVLVAAINECPGSQVALRTTATRIHSDANGRAAAVSVARGGSSGIRRTTIPLTAQLKPSSSGPTSDKFLIRCPGGVVCNVPVWSVSQLLGDEHSAPGNEAGAPTSKAATRWAEAEEFTSELNNVGMTRSYLHLHIGIDARGLDLESLEAHYTVMMRGLVSGDPCGQKNMVAVSNPCKLDPTLAPEGFAVIHAYLCGNEPYEIYEAVGNSTEAYEELKEERAQVLWSAVEQVIPDVRTRTLTAMVGSPLTHERYLRRPRGTYGATFVDALPNVDTSVPGLVLCGDSIFPGIGVPAVALNGTSAANAMVPLQDHIAALARTTRNRKQQ